MNLCTISETLACTNSLSPHFLGFFGEVLHQVPCLLVFVWDHNFINGEQVLTFSFLAFLPNVLKHRPYLVGPVCFMGLNIIHKMDDRS